MKKRKRVIAAGSVLVVAFSSFVGFQTYGNSKSDKAANISVLSMKEHFAKAFESSDPVRVAEAGENLELLIANVKDLQGPSTQMIQALATAFAGAMINPLINQQLLDALEDEQTTGRLREVGYEDFKPRYENLLLFIEKLAAKPEGIRTISAAFGPMIASFAKLEVGLPTDQRLTRGVGVIVGAMQVKLDKKNESRRALIEGLSISASAMFPSQGALAGGPAGTSATVGFSGPNTLDYISSKVESKKYRKDLENTSQQVLDSFQSVYVLSCVDSLSPSMKDKVHKEFDLLATGPAKLKAKLSAPSEKLRVTNFTELSPADIQAASVAIVSAAVSGKPDDEINTILSFGSNVAAAANRFQTSRRTNRFAISVTENSGLIFRS
jgi:hypothetical protein